MNRKTKIFILVAVALLSIGAGVSCQRVKQMLPDKEQHLVGGYSRMRKPTAEELALFERVVGGVQGAEYKPVSVSTQIVAGVNYSFLCRARVVDESGKKGKRFDAAIVVYKPLVGQGEERIISIEKSKK